MKSQAYSHGLKGQLIRWQAGITEKVYYAMHMHALMQQTNNVYSYIVSYEVLAI